MTGSQLARPYCTSSGRSAGLDWNEQGDVWAQYVLDLPVSIYAGG